MTLAVPRTGSLILAIFSWAFLACLAIKRRPSKSVTMHLRSIGASMGRLERRTAGRHAGHHRIGSPGPGGVLGGLISEYRRAVRRVCLGMDRAGRLPADQCHRPRRVGDELTGLLAAAQPLERRADQQAGVNSERPVTPARDE